MRRRLSTQVSVAGRRHNPGEGTGAACYAAAAGTREEDALLAWPITGRYRWALD
jgi:uncharacterized protein YijF (DUF1287 family)